MVLIQPNHQDHINQSIDRRGVGFFGPQFLSVLPKNWKGVDFPEAWVTDIAGYWSWKK
jgi:hypothetical protein